MTSSQIDDCTLEWTFEENSLDYVHVRFLSGSIADWNNLFRQAYRCLKPGGYIESMEPSPYIWSEDGTVDDKSALAMWGKIFEEGGRKSGRSWTVADDGVQEKEMEKVGFKNINIEKRKVSIDDSGR